MKLVVKNKLFSMAQNSTAVDENSKIVFTIKGNVFSNAISRTHKKVIKDINNKKLFVVRNKFWHKPFFKSAIIYKNKKKIATVERSHLIKNNYTVVGATEPITVKGNGWNLNIELGQKNIGSITLPAIKSVKDALRVTDAYVLEFDDPQDAPFLVAMMIAIDNIKDAEQNAK